MVLVANGLTMSQQCALVAQKGGCSSLLLSHCRPPQFQAGWKLLMRAQWSAVEMVGSWSTS